MAGLADELAERRPPGRTSRTVLASRWSRLTPRARLVLDQLMSWLGRVYLRYPDAGLPECWLWHPDVIEELLWLRGAWRSAYHGPMASAQRAADWHDRQRPGVVRRIRAAAGSCSLREHLDQPAPHVVPAADAAPAIAVWWAGPAAASPPVPTGDQIRAADAARLRTPLRAVLGTGGPVMFALPPAGGAAPGRRADRWRPRSPAWTPRTPGVTP